MAQPALPRVLVAGTQEAIDFVQAAAGGEIRVVPAQSVEAAVQRLDASIALILANIGFDDSRIFDFLAALHEGAYRNVPVVCFRMQHGSLPPAMEKAVELALAELGIAALVDLSAIAGDQGIDAAMEELRERLRRELAPLGAGTSYDSCVGPGRTDNRQDRKR
jgi:hypothetical protein